MELCVTLEGNDAERVSVLPLDIVMLERKYKVSVPAMPAGPSYEQTLYLAYLGLRRTQRLGKDVSFDAFLATVVDVGDPDEDDEGNAPLATQNEPS